MTDVMKYLRDAPLTDVVLHVAGRPDIDAAALQRGIRYLFSQISAPAVAVPIAAPTPAPSAAKPRATKRGAHPAGSVASILAAVNRVAKIISKRNSIPALTHIRLTIRDGMATLTSTDMELTIIESVAWDAPDCDGLIPAEVLRGTLKGMDPGARPHITQGAPTEAVPGPWTLSGASIASLPVADFPSAALPATWQSSFTMSCEDIRRLFGRVAPCMSAEEVRYYLNGIYLCTTGGELRAVATDGHRLGVSAMPAPAGSDLMPDTHGPHRGVIVTDSAVKAMLAMLPESGSCQVDAQGMWIQVTCGALRIVSMIIDGRFPDYERVMPQRDAEKETRFCNPDLVAAIKAVTVVSEARSPAVKMTWESSEGFNVKCFNTDAGSMAQRDVSCRGTLEKFEIGAQAGYLLSILAELGEQVWVSFSEAGAPMLIGDMQDDSVQFVLMPFRL